MVARPGEGPLLKLDGHRCTLRRWAKSDVASLVRHANNLNVAKHLRDRFPHPYTRQDARGWLELAVPVLARHGVTAAFENHKDFRVPELLPFLKRLGSERVQVCVDFANNFALLEDNEEVVETLAPVSAGAHVKDMALGEYADGFLAADVPLGQGVHDLPRMIGALRAAKPASRLCLEMSTRDPLKVPVFTEKYWRTLKEVPGSDLARALRRVREKGVARERLPAVDSLPPAEKVRLEEEAVRVSLAYAAETLKI